MKIEILPDDQERGVLHLSVDDEFYREIHTSVFGKRPKFSFHESDLSEQFAQKEFERSRFFVMKKLSQRSYSSFELHAQLKERLVSQVTIDRVIEECAHLGYVDDKAWLEQFIQMQLLRKSGPKMIEAKLYQKGVPKSFYEPVLVNLATHKDQKEAIERLIQTRFRSKNLSDFKERQKVFGALVRKGFDFEVVKEAIKDTIEDV